MINPIESLSGAVLTMMEAAVQIVISIRLLCSEMIFGEVVGVEVRKCFLHMEGLSLKEEYQSL